MKPSYIESLTWDPMDMSIKVLRMFADGLNLYKHVDKLTVCDYHSQSYFSTLLDSISTFWGSDGQMDIIREDSWFL